MRKHLEEDLTGVPLTSLRSACPAPISEKVYAHNLKLLMLDIWRTSKAFIKDRCLGARDKNDYAQSCMK